MAKDKHSRAAKSTRSSVGAPSQPSQPSRKGKKAWRKNVDIQDVEKGLEEMREEERVFGTSAQKLADEDLFQIDTEKISLPDRRENNFLVRKRFSTSSLTSAKILAQRSAVPAVFSRTTTASFSKGDTPKRKRVTQAEKDRLLRIAKRPRKGPFGVILDESEDKWAGAAAAQDIVTKPTPKAPTHSQNLEHPHKLISLPAVPAPHAGTSYNPSVDAHQELLREAMEVEEKREEKRVKESEVKEKMGASGMVVDKVDEQGEGGEADDEEEWQGVVKKQTSRKTKAQKKKAAKLLAEKRHLASMAARKRQNAFLSSLSSKVIRRSASSLPTAEEIATRRQAAILARFRNGLAGQKLGKYVVPEDEVDVQLGEDLTETLRGLKASFIVEGNLFKDRFLNLQQRALIEPRTRVLPKKAKRRVVEYEKHAWKRFDRVVFEAKKLSANLLK
ncbi:P60-like protein [Dendrothele bispora CBS 962.96]|uniref:Ribosome biogenesis protein NOP53 n=1 Tax=Dendrothele bispora (strain CBS 962.96) TaxID=1314807 RepID=A0A4S8L7A5_DENBC|nr:P60-like protein [Dendrothele bispora CBS 962.96]